MIFIATIYITLLNCLNLMYIEVGPGFFLLLTAAFMIDTIKILANVANL